MMEQTSAWALSAELSRTVWRATAQQWIAAQTARTSVAQAHAPRSQPRCDDTTARDTTSPCRSIAHGLLDGDTTQIRCSVS